jgi:hypothetical protein
MLSSVRVWFVQLYDATQAVSVNRLAGLFLVQSVHLHDGNAGSSAYSSHDRRILRVA